MSLFSACVLILLVILAEALGVSVVVLMFILLSQMGGLALDIEEAGAFNLHPFLMTFGLVFLYGNGILVYRAGAATGLSRFTLKLIHFIIQLVAFIMAVLALVAVFRYHGTHGYPNMMSLHNWVGMATVVFFGLQLLFGFLFFLFPRPRESIRSAYKGVHLFFGFFIFGMVAVSILTGLTEQIFYNNGGFDSVTSKVLIANMISIVLVAFIGVVTFTVTSSFFEDTDEKTQDDIAAATSDEKSGLLEMKPAESST